MPGQIRAQFLCLLSRAGPREADSIQNSSVLWRGPIGGPGRAEREPSFSVFPLMRTQPGRPDRESSFCVCSCAARSRAPGKQQIQSPISASTRRGKPVPPDMEANFSVYSCGATGPERQMRFFMKTLARARPREAEQFRSLLLGAPGEADMSKRISPKTHKRDRGPRQGRCEPNFCVYSCKQGVGRNRCYHCHGLYCCFPKCAPRHRKDVGAPT